MSCEHTVDGPNGILDVVVVVEGEGEGEEGYDSGVGNEDGC